MKHYENDDDHLGVDPSSHSVQRQTPTTTTPELKEIKGIQTQTRGGETKKTDQIIKNTDLCSSRIGLF